MPAAISRSPCSTCTSTEVWPSAAVEKIWLFVHGMVVLRSIRRVNTPPIVSMPRDSGRNVQQQHVLDFAAKHAALNRGADGHALVRVDALAVRLLAGDLAGQPPAPPGYGWSRRPESRLSISLAVRPASRSAFCIGATVASTRSRVSSSNFARVRVISRCFGPVASAVMNGRLMLVLITPESSIFAFSAASFRRWSAIRSALQVDVVFLLELGSEVVDDALVEVVAAQTGVAVGGQHLEHAVADLQQAHVERAAAEVVNQNLVGIVPCQGRRPARRPSAR